MNKAIFKMIGYGFFLPAALIIDAIQLILDLGGIGAVTNRIIDIAVACTLAMGLAISGNFDKKIWLSLLLTLAGEEIPFIDIVPFWTLDVIYILRSVREREKSAEPAEAAQQPRIMRYGRSEYGLEAGDREDADTDTRRAA